MSSEIISKVAQSFDNAVKSGDLSFFPSTITKQVESSVEFEIRLCPALQKKAQLPILRSAPDADAGVPVQGNADKNFDPFSPPYNPNLHIGDLRYDDTGEEHAVLLNKYSVVPHHFLLVTKEFKLQSSPLMPPDLVQAYLLLVAARKAGRKFIAFYNCGDNSGASQRHKHLQFIPVGENGPPIEQLAISTKLETPDKPFSLTGLSYANHVFRFPSQLPSFLPERMEDTLSQAFLLLLDLGISTIRHDPDYPPGKPSYNVLLTLEHIHLIPRRQEAHVFVETGETLSVNSLGFAGMLLVKSDEELEAVKKETIAKILQGVGLESVHDLQVAGTSAEAQ